MRPFDELDAEFDALRAIALERLTSRQGARLRAIQQERLGPDREEEEEEGGEEEQGRGGRRSFLALVVFRDSGMFARLVLLVALHLALCSLLTSIGPRCWAYWLVWTRRTVFFALVADIGGGKCTAGFAGFLHLAMSSLPWFAGPDARHHGRYEPEGLFRALIPAVACTGSFCWYFTPVVVRPRCSASRPTVVWRDGRRHPCRAAVAYAHGLVDHGDSTVAVLGQGDRCPLLCVSFRFLQVVHMPVVCNGRCHGYVPQLQLIDKVVYTPVVAQRSLPMVTAQQIMEIPLLPYTMVFDW